MIQEGISATESIKICLSKVKSGLGTGLGSGLGSTQGFGQGSGERGGSGSAGSRAGGPIGVPTGGPPGSLAGRVLGEGVCAEAVADLGAMGFDASAAASALDHVAARLGPAPRGMSSAEICSQLKVKLSHSYFGFPLVCAL